MEVKVVTPKIYRYLKAHLLEEKWRKVVTLFESNVRHPSLHTELLNPKEEMVYSFRVDRKYRALFVIRNNTAYVFKITNHYRK